MSIIANILPGIAAGYAFIMPCRKIPTIVNDPIAKGIIDML